VELSGLMMASILVVLLLARCKIIQMLKLAFKKIALAAGLTKKDH